MIHLSKLLFTPLSSNVSYIFLRESYDPSPKKKKKGESYDLFMGVIYLSLFVIFSHLLYIHNNSQKELKFRI